MNGSAETAGRFAFALAVPTASSLGSTTDLHIPFVSCNRQAGVLARLDLEVPGVKATTPQLHIVVLQAGLPVTPALKKEVRSFPAVGPRIMHSMM